ILFRGHDEVAKAHNGLQAAEMALIRLAYAADLPSPDEVIARLTNQPAPPPSPAPSLPPRGPSGGGGGATALRLEQPQAAPVAVSQPIAMAQQPAPTVQPALATVASYKDLIALATAKRDILVRMALESQMRPVSFEQGKIEIALAEGADPGIVNTLSARLQNWT